MHAVRSSERLYGSSSGGFSDHGCGRGRWGLVTMDSHGSGDGVSDESS